MTAMLVATVRRRVRGDAARGLIAGAAISSLGDWLTTLAVAVGSYQLAGRLGVALYVAARVLPRPVGALLSSRLVARYGPGRSMRSALAAQSVVALTAAAGFASGHLAVVLVAVAASQCAGAVALAARQVVVADICASDSERARAYRAIASVANIAVVVGPLLGAALLTVIAPAVIMVFDAASFVLALGMSPRTVVRSAATHTTPPRRGRATVSADPLLWGFAASAALNLALITIAQTVLVPIAAHRFGSASLAGLLYAAVGIGSVIGALVARHLRSGTWGAFIEAAAVVVFATTPSLAVALAALALCGAGGTAFHVCGSIMLSRRVEGQDLAAATGTVHAVAYAGTGCGALLAAMLAGAPPGMTLALAGMAVLATLATVTVLSHVALRSADVTPVVPGGNEVLPLRHSSPT